MRIIAAVIASLLLHILLGWAWTLLAGVLAGMLVSRRGWLAGAAAVGAGWAVLILFNVMVDARATGVMLTTMGGIMGNLPGFAVVALTLLIGLLLGLFGGIIGAALRPAARRLLSRARHQQAQII